MTNISPLDYISVDDLNEQGQMEEERYLEEYGDGKSFCGWCGGVHDPDGGCKELKLEDVQNEGKE